MYKRGALTLHVLRRRIGDENFFALLRDWTTRYRHSTAVTDDFTGLAANYADVSLRPLWDAWLYSTDVPAGAVTTDAATPTGPITRGSVARVGTATVLTALCGYAVLYLAARDLEPAGFSVFGVFWGAFGLVTGAAQRPAAGGHPRGARRRGYVEVVAGPRTHPMRVAAMVGVVAAAVIAASSPLWSAHVFVESQWLSVVLLSVGLAGFCLHATLLGMLAGVDRWTAVRGADGDRRRSSGWRSRRRRS